MKHNPHTLINVQALSEPQRARHRREVYSCYKAVIDKTPDQLKFDFALWSSKAIKEYVQREYGMSISRRTARRYMQKMGFTYQCPVKTAREQNPALVRKWLETDCPAIRKEAAEKKRPRTAKALKADVVAHLSARKNEPESVRWLFHKKEARYAAD